MSRIGKQPIELPESVIFEVVDGTVKVKGPKGELSRKLPREVGVEVENKIASVFSKSKSKLARAMHGTYRALIANMVRGVVEGWTRTLELVGTGYRAEGTDKELTLNIGFSHPVKIQAPEGIIFKIEKTKITIEGIDKEAVGQIAAVIRKVRPPEPYKGIGIMYEGEDLRRKPGKAAKAVGSPA